MKENTLYLECFGGISGDMTVAALLDLGADKEVLLKALESLHVTGYKINISRVKKCGLDACDFDVILEQEHDHSHHHSHDSHHHDHKDPLVLGSHDHRNLYDIQTIIDSASITEKAKKTANEIFQIVAVAESKAHGLPVSQVHFHEVGAIDSIVDIVAAAVCLDNLHITNVIVSELYEGCGHIKCQHGILPVPVPAVANIAADHGLPLHITSVQGELVTPTGAAIVAAIKTRDALPENIRFRKIGLGAGKRNYDHAGILRAILIDEGTKGTEEPEDVWVLEANIDDCSGETLGLAMDLLLSQGAKDVYYTPIIMKKNRPAYLLGVICKKEDMEKMEELIFIHTTTIGIRKHCCSRSILQREEQEITTPYGNAFIKVCHYGSKTFYYPEYESVKKLAAEQGEDYSSLYNEIQILAKHILS